MFRLTLSARSLLASALIGLAALLAPAAQAHFGLGTVSGVVVDQDGVPLQGVTVSAPGARRAVTDDGGTYSMSGVPRNDRMVVTFAKSGYATTQGVANFQRSYRNVRCWLHFNHGRYAKDRGCNTEPTQVTLSKTLLKTGNSQVLDSNSGGSIVEGGFRVTFPANALTVRGNVDVTITPIDVSTNQLAGAPGDFAARTTSGGRVQLESFSMADFVLTRNGRPVNLKRGATAEIELLLPANTRLAIGDSTPMWYFDTATGLWIEEGSGIVDASTTQPNRLAVFATVKHFTYWNSDNPIDSTCVSGFVLDNAGNPLGGVSVEGFGVDYAGHSYAVPTDANGHYCIQVKTNGTTKLTASLMLGSSDTILSQSTTEVTTGATLATCGGGGCQAAPDVVLTTATACVSGVVLDASGQPVVGAVVRTNQGASATTNASGAFQVVALENSPVRIYVTGYPYVDVTTGSASAACSNIVIQPAAPGTTACLTGTYHVCGAEGPVPGQVISVRSDPDGEIIAETMTDESDTYCIEGLPRNTLLYFEGYFEDTGESTIDSGPGGGSCAAKTCPVAPRLYSAC